MVQPHWTLTCMLGTFVKWLNAQGKLTCCAQGEKSQMKSCYVRALQSLHHLKVNENRVTKKNKIKQRYSQTDPDPVPECQQQNNIYFLISCLGVLKYIWSSSCTHTSSCNFDPCLSTLLAYVGKCTETVQQLKAYQQNHCSSLTAILQIRMLLQKKQSPHIKSQLH